MTSSFGPHLSIDGWLTGAKAVPSPNQDERPPSETVRLLVIHAISLPPGEFGGSGVEQLFTNRLHADEHPYYREIHALRVSAHFFIRRDGRLVQFVSTTKRAWHAGESTWRGWERCNDFSLGIEMEGCDEQAFTHIQYIRLARLIRILRRTFAIEEVVAHADIAPGRKTDPGPYFDWVRLRKLLRR